MTARFGSTILVPGVSRSFAFQPEFACPQTAPQTIFGDITFVDMTTGVRGMTTISGPLR